MLFSEKPVKKGFDIIAMTRIINKLMDRLDAKDYFIYGSEGLGADIASLLGSAYPKNIKGLILSNPLILPSFSTQIFMKYGIATILGEFEENRRTTPLEKFYTYPITAFDHVQDTVPSLRSSPSGLASYIVSLWHAYSASSQKTALSSLFTLDELSTIVYLYWLTDSSIALDFMHNSYSKNTEWMRSQVSVPVSICHSDFSPWRTPQSILKYKYLNITRTNELIKGGMFAHLQDPNAVAADIFSFVELQLL
ncbi:hypothetical protein WR25_03691 [Diploscapter pachys]|uniref:AB hydrolase-1 domain-containing protein n=1 Tax=Diploscapter pachys TaxID=2018661 RepID=A0A2A2LNV9_9BILA|nr:hypothetical protein WR25_03691 [Diploscapter pachys]